MVVANMVVAREPQRFPENQRVFATKTARSMLSMTRFRPAVPPGDTYSVRMEAEDAFVVVFRLRALPAHEFGVGGKVERTAPAQRSTLKIVNLGDGDAYCLHFAPFDTLVIHVPRSALDDITDATGASKIGVLKTPDPWRTRDPV